MNKKIRTLATGALLLASLSVVTPAMADGHGGWHGGGHGGEGWHGGGHGDGLAWGILGLGLGWALAAPQYAPRYYPPTVYQPVYYTPQPVVVQPPVYVEQSAPVYAPPPPAPISRQSPPSIEGNNWWYHCNQPNGYYPYVGNCPSGWQRVAPSPPG